MSKLPILFIVFLGFKFSLSASGNFLVKDFLHSDGTLLPIYSLEGTLDFSGFEVIIDSCRGLVFKPSPAVAPGWNALGTGVSNNSVSAVAISETGGVYIGGVFSNAGGNPAADFIAYWDGSSWNAVGSGLDNAVYTITVSGNNVFAGGSFANAGGNPAANCIARWDGSVWNIVGPGVTSSVEAIAVSGNDIYVGGYFTNVNGNPAADYIVRWDGSAWHALGTGLNFNVHDIAINGSDIYVGGNFTNAGGNANADYIARWDGNNWNALGSGLSNTVREIELSGNIVYVAGGFVDAGGNANADRIAIWDGSSWSALGPGIPNAEVIDIEINGSELYAAGLFTNVAGNANADYVARWNGSAWSPLGSGLTFTAGSIAINGNDVYIGGVFSDAGGNVNADRIARWENTPLPVEFLSFTVSHFEKVNRLDWAVGIQVSNRGFFIERSADGHQYEVLDFISSEGLYDESHSYSFTDQQPLSGTSYYRLRQVDHDGQHTYSPVRSVARNGTVAFEMYPNPGTGSYTLRGLPAEEEVNVRVFDNFGREVRTHLDIKAKDGACYLNWSELPSGIYHVQVMLQSGVVQVVQLAQR